MTALLEALQGASAPDRATFRPEFFRLPLDKARLEALLKREPRVIVHDTLHGQLTELVRSLNPAVKYSKDELDQAAHTHLNRTPAAEYGVWVYYPWNFRLVHLLDEAEFALVRTDRNRNKITREEQAVLAIKKVGVIGLSVGQSVSLTMALERSFGEIRLADFDTLELSNLNRIRSGVHEMGVPKVINTAREIAELDPFLKVTLFPEGITRENLHRFFTEGGDLDLLVEECDSVDIKILARQKAKELGIPVVMDMSDRGCLDIERFDLEPDRPIMHGWIDHLDLEAAGRPMSNEEKVPYMLPIVGVETLSPRLKASVIEVGQTLGTWPQLASSVVLGGALASDTHRRILLDQMRQSGRWFVDPEILIGGEKAALEPSVNIKTEFAEVLNRAFMTRVAERLPPAGSGTTPIADHLELELAQAGALAPSAGNAQPWHFMFHQGRMLLFHDKARSEARWDPDHMIAHIALGSCLENIVLKAEERGYDCGISLFPLTDDPSLVAVIDLIELERGPAKAKEQGLAAMIGMRCTNRRVVTKQPIAEAALESMVAAAGNIPGCRLELLRSEHELETLASICGGAERIRVLDPLGHNDFFAKELRWTPAEAVSTGDGLDIATMELTIADEAALRIAADGRAMSFIDQWNGGRAFEKFSLKGIKTASAVAIVCTTGDSPQDRLKGGRAAQRVWLTAALHGVGAHPISAPIFLFHAKEHIKDLSQHHRQALDLLGSRFEELMKGRHGKPLFMMRLAMNGTPSKRALRRPLSDLVTR